MVKNQSLAAQPRREVCPMTPRDVLTAAFVFFVMGGVFGWSARVVTRTLAARHEAEASYYYKKTDELIQKNKGDIARDPQGPKERKNK